MTAKLYALKVSHPVLAVRAMLEHKGIEHRVVDLPPGMHPPVVRAAGFRRSTVPALVIDGRKVQGSREISRALDEIQPDPPLFPRDPRARQRVEEAERWGEEVLQNVPRRITRWSAAHSYDVRRWLAVDIGGIPGGALLARPTLQAKLFARAVGADDAAVQADLAALGTHLDEVERLREEGVIGGVERNAADFQIASSVLALGKFADLEPFVGAHPAPGGRRPCCPRCPARCRRRCRGSGLELASGGRASPPVRCSRSTTRSSATWRASPAVAGRDGRRRRDCSRSTSSSPPSSALDAAALRAPRGRRRARRQRAARGRRARRAGVRRPPVRRLLAAARRRPRAAARRGASTPHGRRRDLHLKGSGRTPFARGARRQGGRRPDAARVRHRRGDARARASRRPARSPSWPRARTSCARRCCPAPCSPASPRATSASGRSSTPRARSARSSSSAWPTTRSPATTRHAADAAEPVPRAARARRRGAGRARRAVDARRLHPRRDEHRQHDDLRRDDRLRPVRVHGRLRPARPCSARSTTAAGTRTATSRTIAQWNLARLAETLLPLHRPPSRTPRSAGDGGARHRSPTLRARLARRDAREARADRGRRGGRRARRRPAGADARPARRLHVVLPRAVARRARRRTPRARCSPSPAFDAWARAAGAAHVPRVADAMDASTPSTSRATTSSRRRSPPPPLATSRRSGASSTWSRSRSRSGPASRRTPAPSPETSPPVPHVLRDVARRRYAGRTRSSARRRALRPRRRRPRRRSRRAGSARRRARRPRRAPAAPTRPS